MARGGEIIQRQHLCHYGDTIVHPRSGYVTTKLHETSTADATIMRYFQRGLFSRLLASPYAARVNPAVAKHWPFVTPQYVMPTQDVIIAAICNTIYARCIKYGIK